MENTKIIEANVQYNDLKGTAAADVADWNNNLLDNYLLSKSSQYDTNMYTCIGCEIYGVKGVDITFYCRNRQSGKIIPFIIDDELSIDDLGDIFKRLDIVLSSEQITKIEENTIRLSVDQ